MKAIMIIILCLFILFMLYKIRKDEIKQDSPQGGGSSNEGTDGKDNVEEIS